MLMMYPDEQYIDSIGISCIKTVIPDSCGIFSTQDFYFYNNNTNMYDLSFSDIISNDVFINKTQYSEANYNSYNVINKLSNDNYLICIYGIQELSELELDVLIMYANEYYKDKLSNCCSYWKYDKYFFILYFNNQIM
jgi:hypothetical protein